MSKDKQTVEMDIYQLQDFIQPINNMSKDKQTVKMDIYQLQDFIQPINDMISYLTDNSCGDPECCYQEDYPEDVLEDGIATLKKYGIEFDQFGHLDETRKDY